MTKIESPVEIIPTENILQNRTDGQIIIMTLYSVGRSFHDDDIDTKRKILN